MKLLKSSRRPKKPRFYVRRVVGDSMLPGLRAGQLVLFVACCQLSVGDVVMVRHNGLEKIKRIARLEERRVYVLGDNPAASTDSRQFGWLDLDAVAATLLLPRIRQSYIPSL